jgi:glycosyltransferase involved in cell wall biosynthesis
MNTPKVSVIIPVWNAEAYLRRCLDSVVNQTLRNIEIICVNDGSTDSSLAILNEYAAADSRMRVVSLEKNSGESIARNTGLAMAGGEYIGSVDNDDAVDPDFYEKLYAKAGETGADIVKGVRLQIEYDGMTPRILNINSRVREDKTYFISQWWTAIYKASLIKNNNINFPEGTITGGDSVFLVKAVCAANQVVTLDNTFYHYFRRESSGNAKILTAEKVISYLHSCELVINFINDIYSNINSNQYEYLFYHHFLMCIRTVLRPISWDGREEEIKKYCSELLLQLYWKSRRPDALSEMLSREHGSWYPYLRSGNTDALAALLLTLNTWEKFLASAFRARLTQHKK